MSDPRRYSWSWWVEKVGIPLLIFVMTGSLMAGVGGLVTVQTLASDMESHEKKHDDEDISRRRQLDKINNLEDRETKIEQKIESELKHIHEGLGEVKKDVDQVRAENKDILRALSRIEGKLAQ